MANQLYSIRGKYENGKIVLYDDLPEHITCDVIITFIPDDDTLELIPESQISLARSVRERMTKKEMEVLNLLGKGMTNEQIAETLELAAGSVRNYVSSIFRKLSVNNRTEAVVKAKKLGLS